MKVISGGQTGVDRAALDAAQELGLDCGGWCPRGRRAEDGRIPDRYPLRETASSDYPSRTAANVREADATLVLVQRGGRSRGTALTRRVAAEYEKPLLEVDLSAAPRPETVQEWLERLGVRTLNVAGPRESETADIYDRAREFLLQVLRSPTGLV
ncbi:MAG TPA: putative molybdenum carrier protein [Vicinamibacteria bacterium]